MNKHIYFTAALTITVAFGAIILPSTFTPVFAQADTDALRAQTAPANSLWTETLDLSTMRQEFGKPGVGKTVDGHPLTLGGVVYPHGIGSHAESVLVINLNGSVTHFTSQVGVDDETGGKGSVTFLVIVDGKVAAQTPVLHGGDAPRLLSVDLTGAKRLVLKIGSGGDGIMFDHGDWAGAMFTLAPGTAARPEAVALPVEPPRLTMLPADPRPGIHGPRIVGASPGKPFLFMIPATGQEPLTYAASKLPAGLKLDPKTGIISGALVQAGKSAVTLTVRGPRGTAKRTLTIVGGKDQIALTPPLGWNSWNVWATTVDEGKVKDAADEMIAAGLARHGFQYVNMDDAWEGKRSADGAIQTNDKFPDMPALTKYIHSKGLKVGIYSGPGPRTCGGYIASYQHEAQDAATYAGWGIDYLKYDWCSYEQIVKGDHSLPALQKPYDLMGGFLAAQPRDIAYSLCQYGWGDVWKWGASTGGNSWRTTGDIEDSWSSMHDIFERQNGLQKYAGPGHWNDPDMLMVGVVGKGNPHPTHLTPNEQILHISMWCLLSSPLLIGCDMTKLDPFTLALLTNDEALDINQDPLGKPAGRISEDGFGGEVWARPLFDGTHAVGLTNADLVPRIVTVRWSDLGLTSPQPVRDLWLHKDLGKIAQSYSVNVPSHGVVLLKIGTPARQ